MWSDTFDRPTLGANASIVTNQLLFVHANTDPSRSVYYQPWLTSFDTWTPLINPPIHPSTVQVATLGNHSVATCNLWKTHTRA